MARVALSVIIALSASILTTTNAQAAKKSNPCTSKAGLAQIKYSSAVKRTIKHGQYYVREHKKAGTITVCDSKAPVAKAYWRLYLGWDGADGTKYKIEKVLSIPGKCVALKLKQAADGQAGPAASIVDTRLTLRDKMSFNYYVGYPEVNAKIFDFKVSKTCVLGATWGNGSSRGIYLRSSMTQNGRNIKLSGAATDGDLWSLKLSGDSYSYTDAGKGFSGKL